MVIPSYQLSPLHRYTLRRYTLRRYIFHSPCLVEKLISYCLQPNLVLVHTDIYWYLMVILPHLLHIYQLSIPTDLSKSTATVQLMRATCSHIYSSHGHVLSAIIGQPVTRVSSNHRDSPEIQVSSLFELPSLAILCHTCSQLTPCYIIQWLL